MFCFFNFQDRTSVEIVLFFNGIFPLRSLLLFWFIIHGRKPQFTTRSLWHKLWPVSWYFVSANTWRSTRFVDLIWIGINLNYLSNPSLSKQMIKFLIFCVITLFYLFFRSMHPRGDKTFGSQLPGSIKIYTQFPSICPILDPKIKV